jgi:hypothetical protein
MTEHEEWIRKAAIAVVLRQMAELQCCGDADAPEQLEMLQRLLAQLEKGWRQ